MSREDLEPLLSQIFSEKGLVQWILSFDDYPRDLIRKVVNIVFYNEQNNKNPHILPNVHCWQCESLKTTACGICIRGLLISWCPSYHLELKIDWNETLGFSLHHRTSMLVWRNRRPIRPPEDIAFVKASHHLTKLDEFCLTVADFLKQDN